MPSLWVWRALSACAEGGNLHRCPVLDCIACGVVVRAPFGGWGYCRDDEGEMQFPDDRSAILAMTVLSCWPTPPFARSDRPV